LTVRPGIDPETAAAQAIASDPLTSAWVAANAGSGKTFVLSRRVIRLLLAGVDPSRILCLTFTKAAAAEMAKRVFAELGGWTRLSDADLAGAITEINGRRPDAAVIARARRLFAAALETPGGLKMQTIHAFCERLLHQFPFEANVPGHFEVLDERAQAALTSEARKAVLARAAAEPEGPFGRALKTVLSLTSDFTHEASIAEFVEKRDVVRAWTAKRGGLANALAELREQLGLLPDETSEKARARIASQARLSREEAGRLVALLAAGSTNDREAAERLAPYAHATDPEIAALAYLSYFQKDDGEFRALSSLGTNKTRAQWPGLDELLEDEKLRLEAAVEQLRTAELYESTAAMLTLAEAAIDEYERRKRRRSCLDFEDLVVATVTLLQKTDASRWVQFKLDRGIYHVLVDEAQDTSPRQWQVIRALVEDFFAGEAGDAGVRTVFAVGDEKQSIFSFQGAVPAWFSAVQREIAGKAQAGGYAWAARSLHLSFRSVPVVLEAVDKVFEAPAAHTGLTAEPGPTVHTARRQKEPGRVVLWPTIKPPEKYETTDWATPVDYLGEKSPEVQLAKRIAATIKGWLDRGETLDAPGADGKRRPIRAGEILILVRTRGALADAINRQLKSWNVPIAGTDRLALTEHIAVMDLMALGRVVVTPEDDLSLAALLKSPLIGLDEDALFDLAHDRKWKTLWASLADKAASRPDSARAKAQLDQWRGMADLRDPHAFFARVLAGDHGRRAFLTRLGPEAQDVLDEFLGEALRYEENNAPSLEGFLNWLQESATEIKRDSDSLRDEVRVMTVHGAKGLEADVVFLVDNGMAPWLAMYDPRLLPLTDSDDPDDPGPLVWNRSIKAMPKPIRDRIAGAREKSAEEYRRLLYVAMTRARDRLYVVGIDKRTPKDDRRWHTLVWRALEAESTPGSDEIGADHLEWRAASRDPATALRATAAALREVPPWASHPVTREAPAVRLTPSTMSAEEWSVAVPSALPGAGAADSRTRGLAVHRLLQSLPDVPLAERAAAGSRYLAAHQVASGDLLLRQVLAILADPGFAEVFAPGSRAEIDLAGQVETARGPATISGRIDRLAVTADRVLIVDYKTNRPAPTQLADVPYVYLNQLALYRLVLRRLYPKRIVDAGLLWTDLPALMAIPAAVLDAAEMAIFGGFRPAPP
jgi:ATP-dependent helicase/nuclease subunit A